MLERLRKRLDELSEGGAALAFSGGVDSALLMALLAGKRDFYAVMFDTVLHPRTDPEIARSLAQQHGVALEIIQVDEFADPSIRFNPPDRCYRCKKLLFEKLLDFARAKHLAHVLDGTNADDLQEYRPGLKALRELEIASPLAELGITKKQVREMAQSLNLEVARRPSTPCLATRLPYGAELKRELLRQIEAGEALLRDAGFPVVRLRLHGEVARIEIPPADFTRLLACFPALQLELQKLGFRYLTLDLEGFRSGSMDRPVI